jgi:hypothetical protein
LQVAAQVLGNTAATLDIQDKVVEVQAAEIHTLAALRLEQTVLAVAEDLRATRQVQMVALVW